MKHSFNGHTGEQRSHMFRGLVAG